MDYRKYLTKITEELTNFKNGIDHIEAKLDLWNAQRDKTIREMKGIYTDTYISEYKKKLTVPEEFKNEMESLRDKTREITTVYLEFIEKGLNRFFNAPVNQEFVNKIMAISTTGLKLTNTEYKLLEDSASTYMEYRLLNQLAESRTRETTQVKVNSDNIPEKVNVDLPDPYLGIKNMDIDKIFSEFNSYKTNVGYLLNYYAGSKSGLYNFLKDPNGNSLPVYISATADSYFRNDKETSFSKLLEESFSILPENKIKRELTEKETKLINTIVKEDQPLVQFKVQAICENSPELAELFKLDPRYSKYVEE